MIYHLVNYYTAKNKDDKARNDYAEKSWCKLYETEEIKPAHIHDSQFTRSSKDIGDTRPVPYVKDIIEMVDGEDDDVIMLTNMDTILHVNILEYLHEGALYYGCRRELEKDCIKLLNATQINNLELAHETSADVFIFTIGWWKKNKRKYPDMLLGCQWWDTCMMDLMEATKNADATIRITNHIYHRNHKPFWFDKETMFRNPGQIHNRKLSRAWKNPNKKSMRAGVMTWEDKLERDFNKVETKVVVGNATYYF